MRKALLAVDLDGTLLNSRHEISAKNRAALQMCGVRGVVRVIATGRSYAASLLVLPDDTPIDYLIFSSGAGILRWSDRELLYSTMFSANEATAIATKLQDLGYAFMVHAPVPTNHLFWYDRGRRGHNRDLLARMLHYKNWSLGEVGVESFSRGVTQFIVTTDCDAEEYEQLRQQMALVAETIQTTAVYCEGYRWLELFPHGVHKGNAVATLSSSLTISHANVYVVGNDYNDLSMLQHFSNAFLMGNAPESMKGNFALVSSHDEDGVAEVVQLLIESGMGREM